MTCDDMWSFCDNDGSRLKANIFSRDSVSAVTWFQVSTVTWFYAVHAILVAHIPLLDSNIRCIHVLTVRTCQYMRSMIILAGTCRCHYSLLTIPILITRC